MVKDGKLKALADVAEGFGLTAEEVAAYFGKPSVQSKKIKAVDGARPGMYYYSDGTISAEVLSEKQISGVVGWVNGSGRHGLVLGLREARLPFYSEYLNDLDADDWCAAYAFDGVRRGKAFLPSKDELLKIFRNLDSVQEALEEINKPLLVENDWYWSSSRYNTLYACYVRPSDGNMGYNYKDGNYRVRCVLAF